MTTSPDGTVLFVLQGMRKDGGPVSDEFFGAIPFMLDYILAIVILMASPAITLDLP